MSVTSKLITLGAAGQGGDSYWVLRFGSVSDGVAYDVSYAITGSTVTSSTNAKFDQSTGGVVISLHANHAASTPDDESNRKSLLLSYDTDGFEVWCNGQLYSDTVQLGYPTTQVAVADNGGIAYGHTNNYYGGASFASFSGSTGNAVTELYSGSSSIQASTVSHINSAYLSFAQYNTSTGKHDCVVCRYDIGSSGAATSVWEKKSVDGPQYNSIYPRGVAFDGANVWALQHFIGSGVVKALKISITDGSLVSAYNLSSLNESYCAVFGGDGVLAFLSQNSITVTDTTLTLLWQYNFPSLNTNLSSCYIDRETGDVYVAGDAFTGAYLTKFNSSGVVQWQRLLNNTQSARAYITSIDVVGDSMLVSMSAKNGGTKGAVYVAKLPTDGSLTGTYGEFVYSSTSTTQTSTSSWSVSSGSIYSIQNYSLNSAASQWAGAGYYTPNNYSKIADL